MAEEYWFRCPRCLTLGTIDGDQADGRVSIQCECGYHETVVVHPRIRSTEAVRRDVVFSLGETTEVDRGDATDGARE